MLLFPVLVVRKRGKKFLTQGGVIVQKEGGGEKRRGGFPEKTHCFEKGKGQAQRREGSETGEAGGFLKRTWVKFRQAAKPLRKRKRIHQTHAEKR